MQLSQSRDASQLETDARPVTPDAHERAAWAAAEAIAAAGGCIGVAFSGGGDSTALLMRATAWARPRGLTLQAFIVDHGLRAGSRADAERARAVARELGASAQILAWAGDKPATGVQAAARAARYRLMARAALADAPSCALLVGHTRGDQAETALMRGARAPASSAARAAMRAVAPSPLWPDGRGAALIRPLLGASRAQLRAELRAAGIAWIEDPANENVDFERVRARAELATWTPDAVDALLAAADEARAADRAARAAAAEMFDRAAALGADGAARIASEMLASGVAALSAARGDAFARETETRLLEALVHAVSGDPRALGAARAARLSAALTDGAGAPITIAGCVFERGREGVAVVRRDLGSVLGRADAAAAPARLVLAEGQSGVWDGRYLVGPAPSAGEVVARASIPGDKAGARGPEGAEPVLLGEAGLALSAPATHLGSELAARHLHPEEPPRWLPRDARETTSRRRH